MSVLPPNQVWGFTGTRSGMSPEQLDTLDALLRRRTVAGLKHRINVHILVHGMAPGADAEANCIARLNGITTYGRPASPESEKYVPVDKLYPVKPPLDRDSDIAFAGVDGLIAAPITDDEQQRSGTWATVRRGRKFNRRILILLRGGGVREEELL